MTEIRIKLDDNKKLIDSLQDRTKLLEKLLTDVGKSKNVEINSILKVINKSKERDFKSFNRLTDVLSKTLGKIKSPKVVPKADTPVATSLIKRISLLEEVIKNIKVNKGMDSAQLSKILSRVQKSHTAKVEKQTNILLDAFQTKGTRTTVIPSPS